MIRAVGEHGSFAKRRAMLVSDLFNLESITDDVTSAFTYTWVQPSTNALLQLLNLLCDPRSAHHVQRGKDL